MTVVNGPGTTGGLTSPQPTSFEPPGPGTWMLDTTHHGRRPTTPFLRDLYIENFGIGFSRLSARYGLPLDRMVAAEVNGYLYMRPVAVGEGDTPRPAPPAPIMWLISRLHPELRRRAKRARQAWDDEFWRDDVDAWFDRGGRDRAVAANLRLQSFDPATAPDDELADHVDALLAHVADQFVASFETHGGDIMPIGDLIATCAEWGIPAAEVAPLLRGASPVTTETLELLAPVARAMAGADRPTTIDGVRALSPEAGLAIDRWLELHGWRILNSDDIDCPTLAEQPALQLSILSNLEFGAVSSGTTGGAVDPAPVRARVPDGERSRFDRLLADARHGLRLRDDNAGVRVNWPVGLTRRAVLEVGRRLAADGRLADPGHALCLEPDEAQALLRGRPGPDASDVAARSALRARQIELDAPAQLGPDEEPPPFAVLPAAMARSAAAVFALIDTMEGHPGATALTGTGVGGEAYTGRACVLSSPDDDFGRIEPGDVLIAPFTSPSFNSVLPLVGAIAVQEGGVMSHTAIVAREFGIPAVVGVNGLLGAVADGETVTVDPVAGRVRTADR